MGISLNKSKTEITTGAIAVKI